MVPCCGTPDLNGRLERQKTLLHEKWKAFVLSLPCTSASSCAEWPLVDKVLAPPPGDVAEDMAWKESLQGLGGMVGVRELDGW